MVLLLSLACGTPSTTCSSRLADASATVRARWPNADSASKAGYSEGCSWEWAHGTASVDGMGATMVLLREEPGLDDLADLDLDVFATGRLDSPSLLFFDRGDGGPEQWPLVGMGYHFDYLPCDPPDAPCLAHEDFFVHEAGYHHVLLGTGGMSLATDADLLPGGPASVDRAGCEDIDDDDLRRRLPSVKHGRAWDLHVWFASDGGDPVVAVEDPEERWRDAPVRVSIDAAAFFYPDDAACSCPSTEDGDTVDTGLVLEPACGEAVPPSEEPGCGAASAFIWLGVPGALFAGSRRVARRATDRRRGRHEVRSSA